MYICIYFAHIFSHVYIYIYIYVAETFRVYLAISFIPKYTIVF